MRTFFDIDLLNKIVSNPYHTIGQRSYYLLQMYKMSYNDGREIKISEDIIKLVESVPSIEEYVASKFGEEHQRTVHFDYYLGLISQDQRQLLEKCYKQIYEYEDKFPVKKEDYSFELTSYVEEWDLKDRLNIMFYKPMMFGIESMAGFRAYLDGYFAFKSDFGIQITNYESKIMKFINVWKSKVNTNIPFDTWDRPFRFEIMGTTDFAGSSDWEIERFKSILEKETGEVILEKKRI